MPTVENNIDSLGDQHADLDIVSKKMNMHFPKAINILIEMRLVIFVKQQGTEQQSDLRIRRVVNMI